MSDRELSYEIIKHFDAFFDANIDASTVLLLSPFLLPLQ
jgi:hypothetical protein